MSRSLPIWAESLLLLLQEIEEGIVLIAPDPWRVVDLNDTMAKRTGCSKDTIDGQPVSAVFRSGLNEELLEQVLKVGSIDAEVSLSIGVSGDSEKLMQARICCMTTEERGLVGVISKLPHNDSATASDSVRRDPLTGLHDRAFLLSRMSTLLAGDRVDDRQFAVLFVDLDNFKQINDRHGHLVGDWVLREVAGRLVTCVREGDHVTRFGGDEFVVLLEHVARLDEIDPVVVRLHDVLSEPVVLPEGEFMLSVSVGVAEATPYHESAEDVLRDADRKMYASKRAAL
jgi:diguanylate cyclase (GGDEF)-like protein